MDIQATRRGILKNAASMIAAITGGAVLSKTAAAQESGQLAKKRYPPAASGEKPLYSPAVSYGNLLFLSGVGAHFKGTIEEHTQHVLDELQKTLESAGSSLQQVLKVNVYLNDLKDYDAMNKTYAKAGWGSIPPVRTTVAPAGGVPGNSLIEIDVIAHI